MAKKNTNQAPVSAKPQGFKTRNGANNKTVPLVDQKKPKSPEEIKKRNGIIITVVAAILIVAAVAGVCAIIISAILKGDSVDYLKDDLSAYIKVSKDEYTGMEINIPLKEYSDAMLTAEINKLIVKNKSKDAEGNGVGITNKPVALGDNVSFRYRIYTVDENGKQTEIPYYCNFNDSTNKSLVIGSQSFYFLGFEEALIGVVPSDYDSFRKIKTGSVSTGDVIYLSYTAFYPNGAASSKSYERIDLSRDDVDATYGEGFKNYMIASPIGEVLSAATFKTENGSIGYADMKVEFATQCEASCLTLDVTFPADHADKYSVDGGKSLRGVDAKIDVYLDSAVKYQTPEYNAEFITGKLGMTEAELASYEGDDLVAKHKSYLKSKLLKGIEQTNETLIHAAIWTELSGKGEMIKYPTAEVDKYIDALYSAVESFYNEEGEARGYPSIDSAAIAYFELDSGADWEAYMNSLAEEQVKTEILLYYIIRKEGWLPNSSEYDAVYKELFDKKVDSYLEKLADQFATFEGAEYDEQVRILKDEVERVFGAELKYATYQTILLRHMASDSKYVTIVKKA